MNNKPTAALPTALSSSSSLESLLHQVAKLCAVGYLPEATAFRIFRDAYNRASSDISSPDSEESDAFIAAQVLTEWHQNPAFLDTEGKPRELSITANEFSTLCNSASDAADASRILELLLHAGAMELRGKSALATRRELIIGDTHPAAVSRAVRLSSEFISTLTHNLARPMSEPSRFERTVVTSKLAARNVPSLLAYLSLHGQAFLEDLDSWMSARETADSGTEVGVGVYLYVRKDV